ncbi:MAG: hypothetical protein K6C08_13400 [Oscillospiraceae bacterium]|nr:hypothetical protein [Oscillospiraceae bacterium]
MSSRALLLQEENICLVLDTTASSRGIDTLFSAAEAAQDRTAAEAVMALLDGQTLLLSTKESSADTAVLPAGLGESYQSFIKRQ